MMLWWEKTVEYFFVMKHVNQEAIVAPLSGKQEAASDLILGQDSKWILIEFKRNRKSIDDEISKFTQYHLAKECLEPDSSHHFIIYGEIVEGRFTILGRPYFAKGHVEIDKALASGIELENFKRYITEFVEFKKTSTSGSGGYEYVAGVTGSGAVTSCMTLSEFAEAAHLDKDLLLKLQRKKDRSRDLGHGHGR